MSFARPDDALLEAWLTEHLESGRPLDELCAARPDLRAELSSMAAIAMGLAPEPGSGNRVLGQCLAGRYTLVGRLGAGAMGLVYAARDEQLGREVAVKVLDELFAADAARVERFRREAQSLAALADPHIVAVHDLDLTSRPPFLVMERVFGFDLAAWIGALRASVPPGRLPEAAEVANATASLAGVAQEQIGEPFDRPWPQLVAMLGIQIGQALTAAHRLGVTHRDVKPSNLMLDAHGRVRLLDFGLARRDADPTLTRADARVGTPLYMAPEQVRSGTAGVASDLYSFGATLFELVFLRPAFATRGPTLEAQILYDDPVPPPELLRRVPRDLTLVCFKAMSKRPAQRYLTAPDMVADLERFVRFEPVTARPWVWPAGARQLAGLVRRHRSVMLALLIVAALALGTALVTGRFMGGALAAGERARRAEAHALRAALPPTLGFGGGVAERLRDPSRPAVLARLARAVELEPEDASTRFLELWVRGEEDPVPAVVAADRAILARQLGASRLQSLYDKVALVVQRRARRDRSAGLAQMEAALQALDEDRGPADALARRLRITVLLQLAEFAEHTQAAMDQVLALVAEDEQAAGRTAFNAMARGFVLQAKGLLREARLAYQESDRLCPDTPSTLHGLARIHRLEGNLHEARRCAEAALARLPTPHWNYVEQHAVILRGLGEFAAAHAAVSGFACQTDDERTRQQVALLSLDTVWAAQEADPAQRKELLRRATATVGALRSRPALGKQHADAVSHRAADLQKLQLDDVGDEARLFLDLLLDPDRNGRPDDADPLNGQLLSCLVNRLDGDPGHLTELLPLIAELLRAQTRVLQRLAEDGVQVR